VARALLEPVTPSDRRMTPGDKTAYSAAMLALIDAQVHRYWPSQAEGLTTKNRFALARALLREKNASARGELMEVRYGMYRGLTTASAVSAVIFLAAAIHSRHWEHGLEGILIAAVATYILFGRFKQFGWRFADQAWTDFAGLEPKSS
jgi:hypothetical protein